MINRYTRIISYTLVVPGICFQKFIPTTVS
jgi:hypothetical protein